MMAMFKGVAAVATIIVALTCIAIGVAVCSWVVGAVVYVILPGL